MAFSRVNGEVGLPLFSNKFGVLSIGFLRKLTHSYLYYSILRTYLHIGLAAGNYISYRYQYIRDSNKQIS